MLHPRYLVKHLELILVFACLSFLVGLAQESKWFVQFGKAAQEHRITTPILAIVLVIILALCCWGLFIAFRPRYALCWQASAASLLFLVIFAGASAAGFSVRLWFLSDPAVRLTAFRARDLVIATAALNLSGTAIGSLYSSVFVQKVDYTKLRAEVKLVLSAIETLRQTCERKGYLSIADVSPLIKACGAAHGTATDVMKLDTRTYGALIDTELVQPLATLDRAASDPAIADAPETFLRACGLIDDGRDDTVFNAFRLLKTRAEC